MLKQKTERVRTTISLHPEIMAFIHEETQRLHVSTSQVIEQYLMMGIKNGKITDQLEETLNTIREGKT